MLGWFLSRPRLFSVLFLPRLGTIWEERWYAHAGLDVSPAGGGRGRGGLTIGNHLRHIFSRISHWGSYIISREKKIIILNSKKKISSLNLMMTEVYILLFSHSYGLTGRYSFGEEGASRKSSDGWGWRGLEGGGERDVRIEGRRRTQGLRELGRRTGGCGHHGLTTVEFLTLQ